MGSARKTSENAFFFGGYYVRLTKPSGLSLSSSARLTYRLTRCLT